MTNPISRVVEPVARVAAIACGYAVLALSIAIAVEILGRKLFGFSLQGIDEVGGYTTAIVSSLACAWALVSKSHTRVDFLLGRMPEWLRAVLNALAYALLAGLAAFATWRGWDVLDETLLFDSHAITPLGTPLWIPQSLWLAGFATFAAVAALYALHALWLLAVYVPIAHWVWSPEGWLAKLGALDFAGGAVVHINAGAAALVVAYALGPRTGYGQEPFVPFNLCLLYTSRRG